MVVRTSAQWSQIIQKMLPKGRAWNRGPLSDLYNLCLGLSDEFARADVAVNAILTESDPSQTIDCITDWENMVGLPDSTQAIATQLVDRRADVERKLYDPGGQSPSFFQHLATSFGYTIITSKFKPFTAGVQCGRPLYGPQWRFYWGIYVPAGIVIEYFSAGQQCGGPIASWRNSTLEAVIKKAAQSHITCLFFYGSSP